MSEEVVTYADHGIYVSCFYEFFSNIFILALAFVQRIDKTCTPVFIQITVEIGNPQIICITNLFVLVDSGHTKWQTFCVFARLCFYFVYIKRRICHNIITASIQIVSIVVKAVCFITGFDNTGQAVNCHIHQTQLCIVFYFFLTIESHCIIGIHAGLIYKIARLNEHTTLNHKQGQTRYRF